jgi:hypothetical protein
VTVSVASFKAAYPAFAKTDATMLAARLAEVELVTSDSWGTVRDLAVSLQLADALTTDPMGRDAQATDQGETAYRRRYNALARALACGNSLRLGTVDLSAYDY